MRWRLFCGRKDPDIVRVMNTIGRKGGVWVSGDLITERIAANVFNYFDIPPDQSVRANIHLSTLLRTRIRLKSEGVPQCHKPPPNFAKYLQDKFFLEPDAPPPPGLMYAQLMNILFEVKALKDSVFELGVAIEEARKKFPKDCVDPLEEHYERQKQFLREIQADERKMTALAEPMSRSAMIDVLYDMTEDYLQDARRRTGRKQLFLSVTGNIISLLSSHTAKKVVDDKRIGELRSELSRQVDLLKP